MSKTVIIPDCRNPFEVFINNHTYSYPAGTTQIVPDEVAAVIEAHKQVHEEQTAVPAHKYDGVTLPVIEISTPISSYQVALNAEDGAKLDEVVALGIPVVIKAMYFGSPSAAVYSVGSIEGMPTMFTPMPTGYLAVSCIGGAWTFMASLN